MHVHVYICIYIFYRVSGGAIGKHLAGKPKLISEQSKTKRHCEYIVLHIVYTCTILEKRALLHVLLKLCLFVLFQHSWFPSKTPKQTDCSGQ